MKQIIIALGLLWSVNAMATDVMVCKQGGYAANAEDFHNIKVEDIVETRFEITPERVINTNVGIVFDIVDPSTVGFEDLDIKAYMNRYRNEVLYLYKNDSKQLEIGVSALIDDSDAMYADKTLYTSCSFETTTGGSQHAVASKSSFSVAQGGVDHTLPVYRF
jgi:hypothetical protein